MKHLLTYEPTLTSTLDSRNGRGISCANFIGGFDTGTGFYEQETGD